MEEVVHRMKIVFRADGRNPYGCGYQASIGLHFNKLNESIVEDKSKDS